MTPTKHRLFQLASQLALLATAIAAFAVNVEGASLTVTVRQQVPGKNTTTPIPGAQVCYTIGSTSTGDSQQANNAGVAIFQNVPTGQITIIATAGSFTGQSRTITMGSSDVTESFVLQSGSGGPSCTAVLPLDNASFVSQTGLPGTINTGQTANVTVTMRNSGTSTWTVGTYKLGSQNPADNTTWGLSRVNLTASVVPGSNAVFSFTITAPSTAGNRNFQWRMFKEGSGFFGAASTNVSINTNLTVSVATPEPTRLILTSVNAERRRGRPGFDIAVHFSVEDDLGRTVNPTHYMISQYSDLRDATWIPYQNNIFYDLGNPPSGLTRYGTRRIHLRVRKVLPSRFAPGSAARPDPPTILESQVRSASLEIEPTATREYRLEGLQLWEMIRYAADHGFPIQMRLVTGFPGGDCRSRDRVDLTPPFPRVVIGYMEGGGSFTKIVEVSYLDLPVKPFTPFWRIKDISVGTTSQLSSEVISFSTEPAGDGFKRRVHIYFPSNFHGSTDCHSAFFPLQSITLEGPAGDMRIDPDNPWKNMFP